MDLLIKAHEATHERTRDRNTRIHRHFHVIPWPTVGHIDSHSARFRPISTFSFIQKKNDVHFQSNSVDQRHLLASSGTSEFNLISDLLTIGQGCSHGISPLDQHKIRINHQRGKKCHCNGSRFTAVSECVRVENEHLFRFSPLFNFSISSCQFDLSAASDSSAIQLSEPVADWRVIISSFARTRI